MVKNVGFSTYWQHTELTLLVKLVSQSWWIEV